LADALALSTAMHAKSEEERAAAARAEAAALLPPEPSKNGGEVKHIRTDTCGRIGNKEQGIVGERVERKWTT